MSTDQRPDPDQLLASLSHKEAVSQRGKLRIYFGASAGVGKTFSMLVAARKARAEGIDVLVGVVETHRRAETIAQLEGLPVLPLREISYRGNVLKEFDIDAALLKRPHLLLMDELAHSNVEGCRHPKRWQDVEELLAAGINVWTTLNVQHLESLNDIVGGITGVRVHETLPDSVLDEADEVVLVDVPADELLARLASGKVYLPQQAEQAAKNFFRKGNLMALREIALRRTAERIQDDVQNYRIEQSIDQVWRTDAALLTCIGSQPGAEHVVRSAARLAGQLNAQWHAMYVETPALQVLPSSERERILATLKLAEELGANTSVITGQDTALAVVEYAQQHNFSKIVLGQSKGSSADGLLAKMTQKAPWRRQLGERISKLAPTLDLITVGQPEITSGSAQGRIYAKAIEQEFESSSHLWPHIRSYLIAALACAATALLATPLLPYLDLANIVMLFLLTVVLVAVRYGRAPAALAAVLSVALFDFFFVTPRFSFAVSDAQYLLTFTVMLTVAMLIGQMTAGLRFAARIAAHREDRARTLFEFSRDLSSALQTEQVVEISIRVLSSAFRSEVLLILPNSAEQLVKPSATYGVDMSIAQWSFNNGQASGLATDTLPSDPWRYMPLHAPMRIRGVLAIKPSHRRWLLIPEQQRQLDTFASVIAIALERVHYVHVAQHAVVQMESERLRNSLLAALSHDLRTPLTALVGLADTLLMAKPRLDLEHHELATAIRDESLRMNTLVNNLLDMARLQSGQLKLRREWQPVEEVIGSAIAACKSILKQRPVQVQLAKNLPLVEFDAVLIERVLANLIENAVKYDPSNTPIQISADTQEQQLCVTVSDHGPGIPLGKEHLIFEKFTRGATESASSGVGLGLSICHAIVQAHSGNIQARNLAAGGAAFTFTLPLGRPPLIEPLQEAS